MAAPERVTIGGCPTRLLVEVDGREVVIERWLTDFSSIDTAAILAGIDAARERFTHPGRIGTRYHDESCPTCGTRVLVPVNERAGDVALDRLHRLHRLLSVPYSARGYGTLLDRALRIIEGRE